MQAPSPTQNNERITAVRHASRYAMYVSSVDPPGRFGTLIVRRDHASAGRWTQWYVDIDQARVGQLGDGERLSWELPPGQHEVQVQGVRCTVEVIAGRFVELRARLPDSAKGWAKPTVEVERWGPNQL